MIKVVCKLRKLAPSNFRRKKVKKFRVLAFSIYILRNLKNFFKMLAFPLYIREKEFKTFMLLKFREVAR